MIELYHHYSLDSDWFVESSNRIGAKLIDNRISVLPISMGRGVYYFTTVIPGISIVMMDIVFTTEVLYKRLKSEEDLYILQFDISEEINDVVVDNVNVNEYKIIKSGFSVMNAHVENSFKPAVGKRIFALRLLVDKGVFEQSLKNTFKGDKSNEIDCIYEDVLLYDYLDSKSKVLLNSLTKKSVFDADFDLFFKGIALKLWGNFVDNYTKVRLDEISKKDKEAVLKTKDYMIDNIHAQFPSVPFLAKMAGMSESKYKELFKKVCNETSKQFFIREKLNLAQKMLKSKEFYSIAEVVVLLNYPRNHYFSDKYFEFFGRTPSKDFVRKLK